METRSYRCRCGQDWQCDDTYRHMPPGTPPEIDCPECEKPGQLVARWVDDPPAEETAT